VRQLLTGGFTRWAPYSVVHPFRTTTDDLARQLPGDSRVWSLLTSPVHPSVQRQTTWCVGELRIHAFGPPTLWSIHSVRQRDDLVRAEDSSVLVPLSLRSIPPYKRQEDFVRQLLTGGFIRLAP
jgi:hypothetical protein